jgi:uncharacterized protein
MKIVLAGATGFLGTPLVDRLVQDRHEIVVLSRSGGTGRLGARVVRWTPDGTAGTWAAEIDRADAVVNLAGESIAARRWTAAQKQRILDSRVLATRSLVKAILAAKAKPSALISGSAVGYYGALDDRIVTEDQPPGTDFLARVGAAWEAEAQAASPASRIVLVRTGIVLERAGGALPKMLPPFWIGAGGPVGSGRQFWPWIHRQDWIDLVRFAIESPAASGPLNATAPTPVTNRDFATALGRALHRPAWLPAPGFALKLLLGEMAESLLLSGQRAVPEKALRLGFTFTYPTLDGALAAIFASRFS